MEGFAHQVALTLKGQTNVALFGPRDPGKTTFINQLGLELAKSHGVDAPPFDVVKVNLQRVVSIAGFIGCVHDAMTAHPVKRLRRAAQRQIGALEKEIGFDIKVVKGSVRSAATSPTQDAETLHAQLVWPCAPCQIASLSCSTSSRGCATVPETRWRSSARRS